MVDGSRVARRIEAELRKAGTPERAAGESRYLKSDLTFLGASLGHMRRLAKSIPKSEQGGRAEPIPLVEELWRRPVFETRLVAALLLELNAHVLPSGSSRRPR